jgi:putative ABC transport system permease protein
MEIQPIVSALLRSKTGAVLVAAQVALTLAIVCNALFVVNARLATADRPSGVDEKSVFRIFYLAASDIDDRAAMMQRDLEVLRAIPGVDAVASINSMPLSTSGSHFGVTVTPNEPAKTITAAAYYSGDSYVKALGLEIVEGRDFEPSEIREIDARSGRPAADTIIVTRHLAKALFPDAATVVGQVMYIGDGATAQPMKIVGVVKTLMGSQGQVEDTAYRSFIIPVRMLTSAAHYAVHTDPAQRSRIMADAEKALTALRTDRVMLDNQTMDELRERRYRHERSGATMLIAVTLGLLVVTASGIVGVASLSVTQRKKQIGVRRALGARRRDILRYFLVENLLITTTGIALGLGLAIGLNQYLVSTVELARLPVEYLAAGMIAVWMLGLAAVFGPAWRASSVPPAVATRSA